MYRRILLSSVVFLLAAARAEAANFAVITSPPTFLSLFILCFAVACVAGTAKVHALVRGGELSRSWQLFMAGFAVLALCQAAVLANAFELVAIPSFVVPAGLVVMAVLFLYGIVEARRVLS
ncbi:MAG: hypothetical protein AB1744_01980 [Candidatus Zixiibacteriota bacterium]